MVQLVTIITHPNFKDICVLGPISPEDTQRIVGIKQTMFFDECAGYSPKEQSKYRAIKEIVSGYDKPKIVRI